MNRHPFLRWYEVLLVRLLVRSPRVEGVMVKAFDLPMAWVAKKTRMTDEPVDMLERAYANSPDGRD